MFQQDLNDSNVTISGCTVERSQLILQRDELQKRDTGTVIGKMLNDARDRNEQRKDDRWGEQIIKALDMYKWQIDKAE